MRDGTAPIARPCSDREPHSAQRQERERASECLFLFVFAASRRSLRLSVSKLIYSMHFPSLVFSAGSTVRRECNCKCKCKCTRPAISITISEPEPGLLTPLDPVPGICPRSPAKSRLASGQPSEIRKEPNRAKQGQRGPARTHAARSLRRGARRRPANDDHHDHQHQPETGRPKKNPANEAERGRPGLQLLSMERCRSATLATEEAA
jgi:hypothetical protein